MTAAFLKITRSVLLAALSLCSALHAGTASHTLSGLPNFGPANAPQARQDTLTLTLDTPNNVLRGKPGQTIGWGYQLSWASNAGDSISFTKSDLTGDISHISDAGYKDSISTAPASFRKIAAGGSSQTAFVSNTRGIGYLTVNPLALPGSIHPGTLRLSMEVIDHTGATPRIMKRFVISTEVTVVVDQPDPVNPVEQTISFAEIPGKSVGDAPFTISPTASSGLPVRLYSLQPDICSVEGNTVTILTAGTCSILAEQSGNYAHHSAPSVVRTFAITKAPATITLNGSLDRNYTGADQTFTATTVPTGLPVELRYNGDTIPPRDPGIYLVQAFINDPSYSGTETVPLTITDNTPPPLSAYATWLQTHFTPSEIQAGAITGLTTSLAGDGFDNLFKYAMGFDPLLPLSESDHASLLRMSGTPEGNSVIFDLPVIAPSDVIFSVQACDNLVATGWQEIARRAGGGPWTGSASVFTGTPNPEGTRVPVLVTEQIAAGARRFYQLRILAAP